MLEIGGIQHASRVIVAPMAGVTDRPFRDLCREFGAFWLVGEMLTSDQGLWKSRKSQSRQVSLDETGPRWVQIAGSDPEMMAAAAKANEIAGADILDINMGCPAKKVCNKAAGSALLRDEGLVAAILKAVCAAVTIPVTLKIRLGWSPQEQNAETIAQIAEAAGIQALTVHGRTRACRFQGEVDYAAIARVKAKVSIPVIGNGDITNAQQASSVLQNTMSAPCIIIMDLNKVFGSRENMWVGFYRPTPLAANRSAKPSILFSAMHNMHNNWSSWTVFGISTRSARRHEPRRGGQSSRPVRAGEYQVCCRRHHQRLSAIA